MANERGMCIKPCKYLTKDGCIYYKFKGVK